MPGAEAQRLANSSDPRIKQRIHFYVDTGSGITPESNVGTQVHAINLDGLYDASADPLGIKDGIPAELDDDTWFNRLESAILDAGFTGVYVPQAQGNQGVAVLLGVIRRSLVRAQVGEPPNTKSPQKCGLLLLLQKTSAARNVQDPSAMNELSPDERRALRAAAHHLEPTAAVAGKGLTPAVMKEIDVSLRAHELIKVKLHGIERVERAPLLAAICAELDCAPVQQIGNVLVLWRPKSEDDESRAAPPRRRATAPKTKKQAAAALEKKRR